jgi:flagellum-specific peptidoglycan hydrolase FlgJ
MPELVAVEFDPFKSASNPKEFTARYGSAAEKAGKALGVDPQVLLGQWGLETGWGKSVVPGTNNLGNIKDFSGSGTSAKDNMTGSVDKYRAYESPDAFVDDYVSLMQRKYPKAVEAKDPLAFATALKEGGYAEDPRYVNKVVQASRMTKPMNPVMAAGKAITDAIIPSANAAEPQLVPVDFDPFAKKDGVPRVEVRGTADSEPKGVLATAREGLNAARQTTNNIGFGALRGAGSIGATLLAPYDIAQDAIAGKGLSLESNRLRRADMDAALTGLGADPNSLAYQGGKLAGEIAGTAGVGTALGAGAKAVGAAPRVVSALQSGGMTAGQGGSPVGNLLTRVAGGAATGGASAGLVNPEDATTGAAIGGALPVATKAIGTAGNALGRAISGGQMAPEVKALADRAKQLGIDIPADRLVNSKPLNALAASLDYVPGSGRAATMSKMEDQLNTALSKTFGQNSSNVTQSLRRAQTDLGSKFDTVLQNNTVKMDQQFLTDLADASNMAAKELGTDGAKIIANQVDEIMAKAANGDIDGQAAYNIKKTLDRISNRNTPEAFYARDLKQKLMAALDRSLGPQQAADFAKVRQQYGNMLALENIAQNGAEGGVSIARLANMKNINNAELQELADISAQFLKSREGAHGAAQRVGAGALALGLTGPAGLAAGMATGRGANMLLNSQAVKNRLLGNAPTNRLLGEPDLSQLFYRAAPVTAGDR